MRSVGIEQEPYNIDREGNIYRLSGVINDVNVEVVLGNRVVEEFCHALKSKAFFEFQVAHGSLQLPAELGDIGSLWEYNHGGQCFTKLRKRIQCLVPDKKLYRVLYDSQQRKLFLCCKASPLIVAHDEATKIRLTVMQLHQQLRGVSV